MVNKRNNLFAMDTGKIYIGHVMLQLKAEF